MCVWDLHFLESFISGAIKFGDDLELAVCESMISSLQNCRMPFQCAHGRPSMVPLMDLSSFVHKSFGSSRSRVIYLLMIKFKIW